MPIPSQISNAAYSFRQNEELLKKSFETDRCQFVNLLGSARALGRLFVVHTIGKVYGGRTPNGSEQRTAKNE